MEAEMQTKSCFVLRIKWPYLLTDSKQTRIILAQTWNVWGINFQETPSNGTRNAKEILRRSPSKGLFIIH
jgi:hypothetical protein